MGEKLTVKIFNNSWKLSRIDTLPRMAAISPAASARLIFAVEFDDEGEENVDNWNPGDSNRHV